MVRRSTAQPLKIDGVSYPSKTAAIMALHALAMPQVQIAAKVGSQPGSVGAIISQQRRKAAVAAESPDSTPGLWTAEKRDKVRRLFGKTMICIAESVQVPPAELLTYVLHGVIPPSEKVSGADEIRWTGEQLQIAAPAEPDHQDADELVAPAEPDRDEDEAELAALAAAEQEPPPPAGRFSSEPTPAAPVAAARETPRLIPPGGLFPGGHVVRLVRADGKYLHESQQGFTDKLEFAWDGTRQQFDTIRQQLPKVVPKLTMEVVS